MSQHPRTLWLQAILRGRVRLHSARFIGFRSIGDVSLDRCGGFNVIIGKNNAGKSNLLLALHSFFGCVKDGAPVSIAPPIGRAIDFNSERTGLPIELCLDFFLSPDERRAVVNDIEAVAPQVRNALERLADDLFLRVTVAIPPVDPPYAYVRSIALAAVESDQRIGAEHRVLSIGDEAAAELVDRARGAQLHENDAAGVRKVIESFKQFGTEFWERVKSEARAGRGGVLRWIPAPMEPELSTNVRAKIDELAGTAESYGAFRDAAIALSNDLVTHAHTVRMAPLKNRVETFAGQDEQIPNYAVNLLSAVANTSVLYLTERRDPIGKREANQLLDLKVTRGGTEKLRTIQQTVVALLGVEIDAFRSEASGRRTESAELDVDRFLVQVNGAGIREALRLILDYEFKRPVILLVEEPEIHLHPALETSMMRYLKSIGREAQIFVTTHSTNFLDTAEMRNVYLATKNGSTQIQRVDVSEAEEAIPRELGIRLSSLFMYDRLLFVEGASDEAVLREWGATLGANFGAAGVGFVPMGGVRNLAHFAADQTLSFLTKRRVKMWFLIDRDERADEDVTRLEKALGKQAILVVLGRRELENYLLAPQAVTTVIRDKLVAIGTTVSLPSPNEVELAIVEAADELKRVAIDYRVAQRLCVPVYPDRKAVLAIKDERAIATKVDCELERVAVRICELRAAAETVVKEVTDEVDRDWEKHKLEIVPGDVLLDSVFHRYGLRFRKERDSGRIAAAMVLTDIPAEVRDLVATISA